MLSRLHLGACLADDMGLGKTIQVLALLLVRKCAEGPAPSLLVAPASLLANWAQEAARFAPGLRVLVAHTSAHSAAHPVKDLDGLPFERLAEVDLVITSYGSLHRFAWIQATQWRLAILDEAQAIKNPGTRQTKAAKTLKAGSRLALTSTPIENRLGDLPEMNKLTDPAAQALVPGALSVSHETIYCAIYAMPRSTLRAELVSPWQRGSNENANGLVREYLPKGMDPRRRASSLKPP